MRVLVVEDDEALAQRVADALRAEHFVVETCGDGSEADFLGGTERYDAAVLDLGLPGLDGVSVLRNWRRADVRFPVLVLTARERWHDKLAAFNAGADDYLVKPFSMPELVVRIKALIRRATGHVEAVLSCGPLQFDSHAGRFLLGGDALTLTAQEQRILAYLMHNKERVISRSELIEHVYERDLDHDSNVIDVLIGRIRRKLGVDLIHTRRGVGFYLSEQP
jgi:two-component system OmpR family response regulator